MRSLILLASLAVSVLALPSLAHAQTREVTLIFKDGYYLSGKVGEKKDFLVDPKSGQSFTIPAAGGIPFYLDDFVRYIHFVPGQVHEVLEKKLYADLVTLTRYRSPYAGSPMGKGWKTVRISDWSPKWDRNLVMQLPRGEIDLRQRITLLTPHHTRVDTISYDWSQGFLTRELGLDTVRTLLYAHYKSDKKLKEPDKRLQIARFLHQASWIDEADRELVKAIEEFPEAAEPAKALRDNLQKVRLQLQFEEIEQLHKVGQQREAFSRLEQLFKDGSVKKLDEKFALQAHDLKSQHEGAEEKIALLTKLLKELPERVVPTRRPFWSDAAAGILQELNHDSWTRLKTFLNYAEQHQRDVQAKREPSQSLEDVLALALTGWLQGDLSAEPDTRTAASLWRARVTVLDYLKSTDIAQRRQLAQSLAQEKTLAPDILMRLIRMLPPAEPPDKDLGTEPIEMKTDAGSYLLQLPPEYHVHRQYPVLILLHGAREKASDMLARWSELAAKNGYVLAVPLWLRGFNNTYGYSVQEHAQVLECLQDLRRKFQVDSDRVFLFGWEQGAEMAFDVGLSHPDQFAGVMPMCGAPGYHSLRYWPNAQYLAFYVVEGSRNGENAKVHRNVFKDWLRYRYPSFYIEYKGRLSEWYSEEVPSMLEWMKHKKRAHPTKELGRYNSAGGLAEEFRTYRDTDNSFYWLSVDGILPRFSNDLNGWNNAAIPAHVQANIATGNELEVKAKGEVKGAKIWNHINIRAQGVQNVSLWLNPTLIDFSKPVLIRLNGQQLGLPRLIPPDVPLLLETLHRTGDRQRLFLARVDMKLAGN